MSVWKTSRRWPFLAVAFVFVYTTCLNVYERPEGIKVASFFIGAMIATSLISRAIRSTELRIHDVATDAETEALLAEDSDQVIRLVTLTERCQTVDDYDRADQKVRQIHNLAPDERIYFFEVRLGDASEFEETLQVTGENIGRHCVLRATSPVIPNAIAAMLIHLEETTGRVPHAYLNWSEGNPVGNVLRFLLLGEGNVAPITHEVLRRAIPDVAHRPVVHVS
jgi:hypothetical protein